MNKTCIEHNEYFTGCISCQHDMAEEIEVLRDKLMKLEVGNVVQLDAYPQLCEVPKCEAERYLLGKVLLQRLNKDCLWYAVYNGQIVDVDRYRSDLEERVRHFA